MTNKIYDKEEKPKMIMNEKANEIRKVKLLAN
jgi:hypothetical protein